MTLFTNAVTESGGAVENSTVGPSALLRARRSTRRLLIGVVLVLAACSSGEDVASSPTLPPVNDVTEETTPEVSSTTTSTEVPATTTTTEAVALSMSVEDATAVWVAAWQTASDSTSDESDVEVFAVPDVAAGLKSTLGSGRSVTNYPAVSPPDENGVVVIHDCLISSPPVIDAASGWYRGEVTVSDSGELVVSSFSLELSTGCVPAVLADEVIPGYLNALAIENEYLTTLTTTEFLAEGVTGPRFDFLGGIRSRFVRDGQEPRGLLETESNPTVFFFNSPTELVVGDCKFLDPEYGVYDKATGTRTDFLPVLVPGQRDGHESTMVFVDGRWKIQATAIVIDAGCDAEGTGIALPVIDVGGQRTADGEETS